MSFRITFSVYEGRREGRDKGGGKEGEGERTIGLDPLGLGRGEG